MKSGFFALLLFFLPFLALMCVNNAANADLESRSGTNPITYGLVGNAQLSYLSMSPDHAPYDMLYYQRLKEAVPGLEQELVQHPNSLAAYIGLMQAEPERWADEIKRLQKNISQRVDKHQEPEPADLFKLGTLRYYQWGQEPPPPHNQKLVTEARLLLRRAWQHDHSPVIGLMLGETLNIGDFPSDPLFKGLNVKTINQQLVQELAGPRAYTQYVHAKASIWNANPPSVSLVPDQNRRPLFAVVQSLRSSAARRSGTLKVVDGKPTMVDFPVPASQLAERSYTKNWYDELVRVLKY